VAGAFHRTRIDIMQMPKPGKPHAKLAALAGEWAGDETIHPTPWDAAGGMAKGAMKCRIDCDGFALVQDYVQKRGGKVTYRGHGVLGYDPQAKVYLWHWSDSMGGVPSEVTRGEWKGNKLAFQHSGPHGHSRYVYTFNRDGSLGFVIENSQDGAQWAPFITAKYIAKRKTPAGA
jgi:hypothetical protein